jgi:hypothetical protein
MKNNSNNNKVRIEKVFKDEGYNEFEIMKELKSNGVMKERIELYRDFVINLICYAHTTYFGRDFLKKDDDLKGHFNWAFNKVVAEFGQEGIMFINTVELREYFFEYFTQQFYNYDTLPTVKQYISFWDDIFSITPKKHKNMMKILLDLYQVFDNALDHKKSLMEV